MPSSSTVSPLCDDEAFLSYRAWPVSERLHPHLHCITVCRFFGGFFFLYVHQAAVGKCLVWPPLLNNKQLLYFTFLSKKKKQKKTPQPLLLASYWFTSPGFMTSQVRVHHCKVTRSKCTSFTSRVLSASVNRLFFWVNFVCIWFACSLDDQAGKPVFQSSPAAKPQMSTLPWKEECWWSF